MERKTAHDFDQDLLILFDAYVHGALDRRGFLEQASKYAVGGVTAAMLLDQLSPKFAEAQVVRTDDPRIVAEYIEYDSPGGYGKMRGYYVRPAKPAGKLPGILVIHENRGLNPHIEDVARRFALENFDAIGAYRTKDGNLPIDAAGTLPNGTEINGVGDLKRVIKGDRFVRNISEKLLVYGLGRGLERYDKRAVEGIIAKAKASDYRIGSLITAIVTSDPFLKRKTAEPRLASK